MRHNVSKNSVQSTVRNKNHEYLSSLDITLHSFARVVT